MSDSRNHVAVCKCPQDIGDSGEGAAGLFALIRKSLRIEQRNHLHEWLQGDLQKVLPHHVLIAAWGDFTLGTIKYDVISAVMAVGLDPLGSRDIVAVTRMLFRDWLKGGCLPFATDYPIGFAISAMQSDPVEVAILDTVRSMDSSLVHGIKDRRTHRDCLYIAISSEQKASSRHLEIFEFLLPWIDTVLRRIVSLPAETEAEGSNTREDALPGTQLSDREVEIMDWVGKGKTNLEIGMILDISAFTVKNHLQRIFRKLNVGNRAQAVALFENLYRCMPSP